MSQLKNDPTARLAAPQIYEAIALEGQEELKRPIQSLLWSAFVAGICISFSIFCEGFFIEHLPQNGDYFLLENLGYTVGFLIVILGRFQLFTENTITVILPLLDRLNFYWFFRTMKLWGMVLLFNLFGTFATALLTLHFPFFTPDAVEIFLELSHHAVDQPYKEIFFKGIPAGFIIASLVWIMPSMPSSKFWIILLLTYVIAIGDFAHVVAGSLEAFLLLLNGDATFMQSFGYIFFAGLGNIVGGTGLFAFMAYAQVREEI